MRNKLIFVLLFVLCANCGCTAGFWQYRTKQRALREQQAVRDSARDDIDSLWKAGFGFNNPNPERIKQGLEPQNFDGSIGTEKKPGYLDQLSSDALSYTVKTAIAWAISRPIQKITDAAIKRDLEEIADK